MKIMFCSLTLQKKPNAKNENENIVKKTKKKNSKFILQNGSYN